MTASSRRFRFVQLEYPWPLGPEPGRYSIREQLGEGVAWVLVLRTLGAPERRRLTRLRRRATEATSSPPPEPVATSRATLVDTAALGGHDAAQQWLAEAKLADVAADGVARLNRALHAHRVAVADPYAHEVALHQALVVRVGYGSGERVADGRWETARELPRERTGAGARRPGRGAALRSQERLAALLAGRDAALACEELTLRARADLDAARVREAALQLRAALETAIAELEPWREAAGLDVRLDELADRRAVVEAVAATALQSGLDDDQVEVVRVALERLEAALRARTAGGL